MKYHLDQRFNFKLDNDKFVNDLTRSLFNRLRFGENIGMVNWEKMCRNLSGEKLQTFESIDEAIQNLEVYE